MNKKSKYILLTLEERNGEYEFSHKSTHELVDGRRTTISKFAEKYAKEFYGINGEKGDDGYYFFGGEAHVSVFSWKHVNEEEYNVLRKYL